jgi:phosphoribosylformimino-5-aminoimidazole carboxamide ribotide isomerase
MRVIGVVDLLAGRAVHARAGLRESYTAVNSIAGTSYEPGNALALARVYLERFGLDELYVADLDAILGRSPQEAAVRSIVGLGAPLWLDAGASSVARASHALDLGAAFVVVGLETLPSYDTLAEICDTSGRERVAFSLDLRAGEPIVAPAVRAACGRRIMHAPAHAIAAHAANAGVGALIVIDLSRVGTGAGPDLSLIARVRDAAPGLTLLAGGGVRGLEDLSKLADVGCDGALVASALHDGRLGADDVVAATAYQRSATR